MVRKKPRSQQLIKKAWSLFSKYIRNKYAVDGMVSCVTCGVSLPVAKMQAGHYIRASKKNTKFDERNVHPQCLICNVYKDGELQKYAIYLRKRYGETILEELDEASKVLKTYHVAELEEMIERWK